MLQSPSKPSHTSFGAKRLHYFTPFKRNSNAFIISAMYNCFEVSVPLFVFTVMFFLVASPLSCSSPVPPLPQDFIMSREEHGDLSILDTRTFVSGMKTGQVSTA